MKLKASHPRAKNIPNSLRKYRRAAGLQQKEVAGILGLKSTAVISRWERGVCLPKLASVFRLAVLYRTMVDALYMDLRYAARDDISQQGEQPTQEEHDTRQH